VSHLRQILLRLVADVPLESPPMQLNVWLRDFVNELLLSILFGKFLLRCLLNSSLCHKRTVYLRPVLDCLLVFYNVSDFLVWHLDLTL
jgi:hypothetical protein